MEMVKQAKQVMISTALPEDCIRNAQVLIVEDGRWHVLAPRPYRMHCDSSFTPVPTVCCPVVDVRKVMDDEGMGRVMAACVDATFGVLNLDGLLTGLEALGAKIVGGGRLAVDSKPKSQKSVTSKRVNAGLHRTPKRVVKVRVQ